jgi:hypothetical protein
MSGSIARVSLEPSLGFLGFFRASMLLKGCCRSFWQDYKNILRSVQSSTFHFRLSSFSVRLVRLRKLGLMNLFFYCGCVRIFLVNCGAFFDFDPIKIAYDWLGVRVDKVR